jgi:hypothetical protein
MAAPSNSTAGTALPATARLAVIALCCLFMVLGLFFLAAPGLAADVFGLPRPDQRDWVRAIGLRDVALALYIAALYRTGARRALSDLLLISVLMPVGDFILVALNTGLSAWPSLLLHAAGGIALAVTALLVRVRS